jgi:uncharacterized protein YndB with AHSA1/START domain
MKKNIVGLLVSICGGFPITASESTPADPMMGRIDTGRTIHFEIVVPCSRQELFRLWTTEEGVRTFFAPRSRIEPRVGGRYEMIFAPEIDPEGENQGTKGARLLGIEQDRSLSFEWITFVLEKHPNGSGPPAVPAEQRNERPLPTWVGIELEDVRNDPSRTRLRFEHKGFRLGGAWDEAFPYFWRQWGGVLGRLGASCSGPRT